MFIGDYFGRNDACGPGCVLSCGRIGGLQHELGYGVGEHAYGDVDGGDHACDDVDGGDYAFDGGVYGGDGAYRDHGCEEYRECEVRDVF